MKKQSTTKGFAILSAAGMIVKVLSLLYIPFLLNILGGDKNYAVYLGAYQIYVLIYVLANSGIPVAISKLVSELIAVKNYHDAVKSFKIARFMLLIVGLIMSVVMYFTAGILTSVMRMGDAKLAVVALAPAVLITSIASAYRGYFQGRGNMTPTAVSQIIEQVLNTIFTLVLAAAFMKYGAAAGCAGGAFGTTVGAAASAIYLVVMYQNNKTIKVPKGQADIARVKHSNKYLIRKIVSYSIPIVLCVGLQYAGNLVDVGNTQARLAAAGFSTYNALDLYGKLGKYQQLINVPIAVIAALATAVLPAISGAAAVKDKQLVGGKINYAFRLCFLIAVPATVGLAVLSFPIYKLIFSAKYIGGYKLMLMGAVVVILMSIVQIQTSILQGLGRLYVVTFYSVLGIVGKILFNYVLIAMPTINIYGAIIGTIAGYLIIISLNGRYIKKKLKVKFNMFKHMIRPIIASVLMGGIIYSCYMGVSRIIGIFTYGRINNDISTVVAVAVGGYTYLFGLILCKGISESDMNVLPRKIRKFIPKKMLSMIK
ncbi:MAG: polysaccharide biosynthesis protein [Bacillota bacterium]|nr:polysaccharide biosynthesis protein [Bacillota bacterium]